MNEDVMSGELIDKDLIKEAAEFLFKNLNLLDYEYLNIHFIPNVLSDTCSIEVKELKDGYKMTDGIALVIITCNTNEEKDQWIKENDIPDSWNVFLDHDRDISRKFSNLNTEYDIPSRLSCLVDIRGNILWSMRNGLSEKRDMLLSNKFNEGFNVFLDSAE
jgi:alkyl hydroperoxide reductase subunit AhpC